MVITETAQNKIQELAKYCTNNGNIDMKELIDIKIIIPSLLKVSKNKIITFYSEKKHNHFTSRA